MTDGVRLGLYADMMVDPYEDIPDLRTLRAWLELQSLNTLADIMAAIVEELRRRRGVEHE